MMLLGCIGAIVIVGVLGVVITVQSYGSVTALVQRLTGRLNDMSIPTVLAAAGADRAIGRCLLPEPPRVFDDFDATPQERGGLHDGTVIFADQARFLECIAAYEAGVLCDSSVRDAFVYDLNRLGRELDLYDRMQANSDGDVEFNKVVAHLEAVQAENSTGFEDPDMPVFNFTGQRAANVEVRSVSRQHMRLAVELAAQKGALTVADLGNFPRKDFVSIVGDIQPTESGCAAAG